MSHKSSTPEFAYFEYHPLGDGRFRIRVLQYNEEFVSPWTPYTCIANVEVKDPKISFEEKVPAFHLAAPRRTQTYIAVSRTYEGDLPVEKVMLITPIDTIIKENKSNVRT